jgi:hypothetical protein
MIFGVTNGGNQKDNPMGPTAAQRRAQHFAEHRQQREQKEQEHRDRVIAEFNGDPARPKASAISSPP